MQWVEKILDTLGEAIELQSPGGILWRFNEFQNWLQVASSAAEVAGGADDGESVFPFYSLDVAHLIKIFDATPEMHWNTMNDEFSVEGKIDGDDAWISFQREPFDDEDPQDVLDPNGCNRKKRPPTE